MDFHEVEASEGLRWLWNAWPTSKIDAARMVLPFGIVCNVLMPLQDMPVLRYDPVKCKGCKAVLNPYCNVDYSAKIWGCQFCLQRNSFPPSYGGINDSNMPAELYPTYSTVEYEIPRFSPPPQMVPPGFINTAGYGFQHAANTAPGFLLVVDTCMEAADLELLKQELMHLLTLMPETARVGLISFGTNVNVHVLNRSYSGAVAFPGDRELPVAKIQEFLGVGVYKSRALGRLANEYMLPASECDFAINNAIEEIQPNASSFDKEKGHRPRRATGAALAVAAALCEGCLGDTGARIMLFVSGPPTHGPGIVVDTDMGVPIRSHLDLLNSRAPHFKKACSFYNKIGDRMVERNHVLDIFACSLDQVGAAELKQTVQKTGGLIVLAETFQSEQFKKSLWKLFAKDEHGNLRMCFNGTLEVMTTKEVKVSGAIGPCSPVRTEKSGRNVSSSETGIGGTNTWKLCTLCSKTAVTIFFDIVNQEKNATNPGTPFFIQFITQYQHGNGQTRIRVTTASRRWINPGFDNRFSDAQEQDVKAVFDQETAAAITAKLAVHKTESEEYFDVRRWLDRHIISVASKFGEYIKEDASSFRLASSFSLYPQFIFHLRRSQFLDVFNNSPDETAFFRLMLNRESVVNTLVMIQPTLFSYSFKGPPVPVLLDVSSIDPDAILLFDSYFFVVLHYGSTIVAWRNAGYDKDEAYASFRELLEAPLADARALVEDRIPEPKLIQSDQHKSQARWLLAKLNPSVTHNSDVYGKTEVIFTDDVSLQVFIEHLQRLAVQSG